VCKAIAATGYDGYIGHEFMPKADPVSALKQAFERCNVPA
jgi:hydroxypyruvate isomerase